MAERTFIANIINIGAESTHGTGVAASKRLECFDWTGGIGVDNKLYRPTGHLYSTVAEENMEWMDWTLGGTLDYNGAVYVLSGAAGTGAITSHGTSATAKDWKFTPPIIYPVVDPTTYTIEQGDNVRAHKATYLLFTSFGYKMSRKDTSISGKMLSQAIQDNITLTASPTTVALAPVVGKHVNVYLDTTSANIGVTQLTRAFQVDYMFDAIYNGFYPLNRAQLSYTGHVNAAPKTSMKLLLEADSNGMSILTNMQQGTTLYMRTQALGLQIDNSWTVTLGTQTSGNFTLTYGGQTTANIAYNASSASVQSALAALSSIPSGDVAVSGSAGGPYTVTFSGILQVNTQALTGTFSGLSTPGNASIASAVVQNTFQHDMALKVSKTTPFKDEQGIFATEWEFEIVEDAAWNSGQAQVFTVTNLLTAL
jgi:hypothetical protein